MRVRRTHSASFRIASQCDVCALGGIDELAFRHSWGADGRKELTERSSEFASHVGFSCPFKRRGIEVVRRTCRRTCEEALDRFHDVQTLSSTMSTLEAMTS